MYKEIFNKTVLYLKKFFLHSISLDKINRIFEKEFFKNKKFFDEILRFNSDNVDVLSKDERAFPGNKNFLENGHYINMFKRYFFSGKYFCEGKKVLDSCSGLGWGTYIISKYADKVVAYDIDEKALEFCKNTWKTSNVNWKMGSALDHLFLKGETFDVALGMETIEHFSKEDGEKYVKNIAMSLKKNGYFIGTSGFPETKEQAEQSLKRNKYHLYIYTEKEINQLLKKYFKECIVINKWMFIAKK